MSSAQARWEERRSRYLPMRSLDDSSTPAQTVQRDAAVYQFDNRHRPHTDFRMIPREADCQGMTTIILLFNDDVAEVTVSMTTSKQQQQQLSVSKIDSRTFSFIAPEQYEEDVVGIEVSVNCHVVGRRSLSYSFSSLNLARNLSTFYSRLLNVACQHQHQQQQSVRDAVDRASVVDGLDEALVSTMDNESTSTCQSLFAVYRHYTPCEGDSGALSPLHVAASHGLASFARRLSALPAAHVAASLLDFDGQTPSNLARCRGNVATADVIDRLTNQHTVSDGDVSQTEEQKTNKPLLNFNEVKTVGSQAVASEPDRQVRGVIVGPAADGSSYFVLSGPITDDQDDQNAAAAVNGQSASVLQATDSANSQQSSRTQQQQQTVTSASPRAAPRSTVVRHPTDSTTTNSTSNSGTPAAALHDVDTEPPGTPWRHSSAVPPAPTPCSKPPTPVRRTTLAPPPPRPGSDPTLSRSARDKRKQSLPEIPPPLTPRRTSSPSSRLGGSLASVDRRIAGLPQPRALTDDVNLLDHYVPVQRSSHGSNTTSAP